MLYLQEKDSNELLLGKVLMRMEMCTHLDYCVAIEVIEEEVEVILFKEIIVVLRVSDYTIYQLICICFAHDYDIILLIIDF